MLTTKSSRRNLRTEHPSSGFIRADVCPSRKRDIGNPVGTKKNPRQLPAGGFPSVSSLSGSEVTLSANVQVNSALVLELVGRGRLRSTSTEDRGRGGEARASAVLLVEEERADFSR